MRIEPEESTLFSVEDEADGDSFRIRIALYPALIYILLLGLTLVSFHVIGLDMFISLRFILYPVIYALWGIFLLLSFIATFSYFTTRIFVSIKKITGRGIFIFARHFEIESDQIKTVTVKQSALGARMQFGTIMIQTEKRRIRIPWVEKPQNAKEALYAIYNLK